MSIFKRGGLALPPMLFLILFIVNCSEQGAVIRACGNHLNDVLYTYCRGHFARISKRSSGHFLDLVAQQQDNDLDGNFGVFPGALQLAHQDSDSFLATRRLARQVVEECCKKPCTVSSIYQYCA